MPAKSRKQQRFMALCYSNPHKAKGKCPSRAVAREFMHMKKKRKKRRGY
jgi:hypothetical protein